MKITAVLQHLDKDGSEGCFRILNQNNEHICWMPVAEAETLANSIQVQLQAKREELDMENVYKTEEYLLEEGDSSLVALEELHDEARREALKGASE